MLSDPLSIEGAWTLTPVVHTDDRGTFHEWLRQDVVETWVGHPLELAQANCSTSRAGVIRGIHYADVPPGQAKYVTCVAGAILDVVVDLRIDSPTYGHWDSVTLDGVDRRAVYLAEGLGHAFMAVTAATVIYLCTTKYTPSSEHGVHPLDPDLAIAWPDTDPWGAALTPQLSAKDSAQPSLSAAAAAGRLPRLAPTGRLLADQAD